MRGDIDGDGKITENDRNRINEHLGGTITLTGADSWCAKVTGNNEISVSDLVQLMQYLEGKTNNLTGIPTFADYYNNWTYHKVDDLTGYWTAEVAINGLKATSDAIVNISNDEGIFYKSELSDGAIRFYATRPPIAEVPATITFKSGTGVITTSYESAKFHASTHSKDGADPITPESIGAVGYDVTQALTDDQKTKARENINAAPGGFGLGSAYTDYIADFNACIKNGWYRAYGNSLNSPDIGGWKARYGALLVSTRESTIYHVYYVDRYSMMYTLERYSNDGGTTWSEWEYVNPPLQIGVEYRTTERYQEKPVYAKLVDCGKFPAPASSKQIAHGISDCYPIRVTGQMSNSNTVPWAEVYSIGADNTIIRLYAAPNFSDQSGTNTVALIHYTKTTD